MNILVTGGAGYIGSYIVEMLVDVNDVIIIDDLSTGHIDGINKNALFLKGDICDDDFVNSVFSNNNIDVVIHMAAKISVEESVINPDKYYNINTRGTQVILNAMRKYGVNKIVFSSTAAVYGNIDDEIIFEDTIADPINPYGDSKLQAENSIIESASAFGLDYVIFRYFNVAGGRKPGYDLSCMSSLIPKTLTSIINRTSLTINGDDYDTKDGTCVRDYIHILDLANAHVLAAYKLKDCNSCSGVYNLGNGNGYTVMDVINSVKNNISKNIKYEVVSRRPGDVVYSVASCKKATEMFEWYPNYPNLDDIIIHMWESNFGNKLEVE